MSEVTYEGGLRTRARHLRSGQEIVTDAPVDNQGKGEAFSPTDLAATALASCAMTIIGIACQQRDIDVVGMRAEVTKVMGGPPRFISAIQVSLFMPDRPFDAKERTVVAKAAEACPVARSLGERVKQDIRLVWPDEHAG